MAKSPVFKVYHRGEYLGCLKRAEDAAAVASLYGDGAQVRYGHDLVVWTEGKEHVMAENSYDLAAETIYGRVENIRRQI